MMRVKWIDGAKAIAILMVIVVHLSQVLTLPRWGHQVCAFGAMGVQLFFLMSVYCCCMTWKPERFNNWYWLHKYKRLAPWYVVGICIYAIYWGVVGNKDNLANYTIGNVLANLLFINGFIPSAQNSIVPGGWSISCIALFVFFFPVIALLSKKSRMSLLIGGGLLGSLISFIGYRYWGWTRFYAYCVPINQLIVFGLGVAFWNWKEVLKLHINAVFMGGGAIIFFLLAVAAVLFTKEYAIFYRHILVSISFVFLILLLERVERFIPNWVVWIGRHSYEIFIFHFAVIWLVFK